ncbi:bifunctional UDP-N-acetylmuramoyl-tripeptide:D-alanyl-D-alanine ligase/alanine racemase [Echinicola pacifica]|uniref:Alanine racemase n=1 Tax=Echinicola pacifica TaxID=346377 RepID=A0A918UMM8_9BACT|nr:bifunctional UDP-N-acetylmuramoyl-tripeptide:D-alanyl-D-alanine ligase/alanine racemase [Echinicola pacifica]GGZ20977.1 bifunctional UDP-N-acetylmuramoyl-tripeptide:D-alanyl-D-alanine ligase/alanine racemase [Echinicola pacifica]
MLKPIPVSVMQGLLQAEVFGSKSENPVSYISTDTRKIIYGPETLFVALSGFKVDGHAYLMQAYEQELRVFVVETLPEHLDRYPEATFLRVSSSVLALQQLAKYQREQFEKPVIAITGSNGKTIVKEWLGQLLSSKYQVAKSPKSYNSQTGVPLSVFGIEPSHQLAILEAGISRPHEMELLEDIIQPDLGIFTTIGTAHAEGFADETEKLLEKIKLFKRSKFIIYRKDQAKVKAVLQQHFPAERLVAWSDQPGSDYTLTVKKQAEGSKITLMKPDLGVYTFQTAFTDEASLENLRHVIVTALTLGMEEREISEQLPFLAAVEMRLSLKSGQKGCLLIDDTYNNDLAGLDVALEFMQNQRAKRRKILIISDLLQAGDQHSVYQQLADMLTHYQLDLVVGVGNRIPLLKSYYVGESLFYGNTKEALESLATLSLEDDLILIKGARDFAFEQIVDSLQEKLHGTVLEINLNALRNNFSFYKKRLAPSTKIMVMVKAFAYGGGATEIAHHLAQLKADYLAVAYTDEGVALRNDQIQLPIMVLNPAPESFGNLIRNKLEPVVYSCRFFAQLGAYCKSSGARLAVHLDLDTGMRRLGFAEEDLEELLHLIGKFPELEIASFYTHLAGADEALHENFSRGQAELFMQMASRISDILPDTPLRHILNSAGIIRYPEYQMDMVRLGIGLYGIEVNGLHDEALQPVSRLKTTISQIKLLKKGDTVGYGRKGMMSADGKIATIALGYADGYDRRFSNGKGQVMIHGKIASVIGNVCMDMTMVDISHLEEVQEGDEVIVYGKELPLKDQAAAIGTISYELLTNISSRVKRVYYMD